MAIEPEAGTSGGTDGGSTTEPGGLDAGGPPAVPDAAPGVVRALAVLVTATGPVPLPAGAFVNVDAQHEGLVNASNTIAWTDVPATPLAVIVTAPDCSQASQNIDATTTSVQIALTCTPVGVDAIDLSEASVYNSPANIASWPDTTAITALAVTTAGIQVTFAKSSGLDRWPDVTPPGWSGPLQYTLWLALSIDGQWDTSGIIQFWFGLPASGGDVTQNDQIALNWVYDSRWGPMEGHQPAVGELVGFFVVAGNERGVTDASQAPVMERSNIVVIPFPAAAGVSFLFGPTVVPDGGAVDAGVDAGTEAVDSGAPGCGVMAGGSSLATGGQVVSCDGRFDLDMQAADGNLVLYFGSTVLWAAGTAGNAGATLSMQTDGNLVVYSPSSAAVWSSGTSGNPGATMSLQDDGNLVVYSSASVALWSSGTGGH